jgi:hypothetical protein
MSSGSQNSVAEFDSILQVVKIFVTMLTPILVLLYSKLYLLRLLWIGVVCVCCID